MGADAVILAGHGLTGQALAKARFAGDPFSISVASGDPLPDGVVVWTRLAPEVLAPDGSGRLPPESYKVRYAYPDDSVWSVS